MYDNGLWGFKNSIFLKGILYIYIIVVVILRLLNFSMIVSRIWNKFEWFG